MPTHFSLRLLTTRIRSARIWVVFPSVRPVTTEDGSARATDLIMTFLEGRAVVPPRSTSRYVQINLLFESRGGSSHDAELAGTRVLLRRRRRVEAHHRLKQAAQQEGGAAAAMVKTEAVVFVDEEEVMFPGFSSDILGLHTKGEKCLVSYV